jgi:hypothetical protein
MCRACRLEPTTHERRDCHWSPPHMRLEPPAWSPPAAWSRSPSRSVADHLISPRIHSQDSSPPGARHEGRGRGDPTAALIGGLYGLCRSPSPVAVWRGKEGLGVTEARVCYRPKLPGSGRRKAGKVHTGYVSPEREHCHHGHQCGRPGDHAHPVHRRHVPAAVQGWVARFGRCWRHRRAPEQVPQHPRVRYSLKHVTFEQIFL